MIDAVAVEFGEEALQTRDLDTAAIERGLDAITLDEVHDVVELNKQLPEHTGAAYHDDPFWEMSIPELIAGWSTSLTTASSRGIDLLACADESRTETGEVSRSNFIALPKRNRAGPCSPRRHDQRRAADRSGSAD